MRMKRGPVGIGVIGCGRWGPNHLRVFSELVGSRSVACCDTDGTALAAMKKRFGSVAACDSVDELLARDDVDAVVVATPVSTHRELVTRAIAAGKDVLCEKPLSTSAEECTELAEAAEAAGRILMVGHVFLYNPGIIRLKESIEGGELGELHYLHATRTNLGPVRRDVGAVADLATHDISILNWIVGAVPEVIAAAGGFFLQQDMEDVAFIDLKYPSGVLANLHVSWLDPIKVRRITAVGSEQMIIWDDLGARGPIEIHDRRVVKDDYSTFGEFQLLLREGDVRLPPVAMSEPLSAQGRAFVESVSSRTPPVSDGRFAAGVAQVLAAAGDIIARTGPGGVRHGTD